MTAALATGQLTLQDQVMRMNPDQSMARIVEVLTQANPILQDHVAMEGNATTGHVVTSRTGLPGVTWRKFNQGIAPTKSKTGQYTESCGMMAGLSKIDVDLAELSGNPAQKRQQEDDGFLQSMSNEFETGTIYHSTATAPEKFQGFAARLASTTANGGKQIIKMDAAAAGNDQASMYLVGWGPQSVYHIYPKGTLGGLQMKDLGAKLVRDANNNEYEAYVTRFRWNVGLVVEDLRYVVRVANIDMGNITSTGSALIDAMIKGHHKIYNTNGVRLAWYANRDVLTFLHLQAKNTGINNPGIVSGTDAAGKPVLSFLGVPIRRCDALLSTESPVT
jgi:hypothetical protein